MRIALWLLALGAPVILGGRALLGPRTPEPLSIPPVYAHLVVLTFGSWPAPDFGSPGPAFTILARRAAHPGTVWATTEHAPGAAVSLWTGRWAAHHGVVADGLRLEPGAWSIASALREAGAHGAAYLEEPLVSASGLEGFDQLIEDAGLGVEGLARLAEEFLAREPSRRALLWLHLKDPGPAAERADALLDRVQRALDASGRRIYAFLLVTALAGQADLPAEGALMVPFAIEFPGGYSAGRLGHASLSHIDLAGLLHRYMRLRNPRAALGQVAPQSRTRSIWNAVRGGRAWEWMWLEGHFGYVLRQRGLRVHVPPDTHEPRFQLLLSTREIGEQQQDLPEERIPEARAILQARAAEVLAGGRPPLDSRPR